MYSNFKKDVPEDNYNSIKNCMLLERNDYMETILMIVYILLMIVTIVIGYTIVQIKLCGIELKDFIPFIKAMQEMDFLCKYSQTYEKMSKQEQLIFLMESEKVFKILEKVPQYIWEDEYDKYDKILHAYKQVRMLRWEEISAAE